MSRYRRNHVKGARYFFTLNLADRDERLLVDQVDLLRQVVGQTLRERPVHCDVMVILPDHLHAVWTFAEGGQRLFRAMAVDQTPVLARLGETRPRSHSKWAKRECGIWQRRFWEHTIRDEADYAAHIRYCWGNPVKHGLVERAVDWPYSSIHRDIRAGRVEPEWCGGDEAGAFGER